MKALLLLVLTVIFSIQETLIKLTKFEFLNLSFSYFESVYEYFEFAVNVCRFHPKKMSKNEQKVPFEEFITVMKFVHFNFFVSFQK